MLAVEDRAAGFLIGSYFGELVTEDGVLMAIKSDSQDDE
jgi:hypothetical protein